MTKQVVYAVVAFDSHDRSTIEGIYHEKFDAEEHVFHKDRRERSRGMPVPYRAVLKFKVRGNEVLAALRTLRT